MTNLMSRKRISDVLTKFTAIINMSLIYFTKIVRKNRELKYILLKRNPQIHHIDESCCDHLISS